MPDRRSLLLGAAAAALAPSNIALADAGAPKPAPKRWDETQGNLTVHVLDLSPQFLAFWAVAKDEPDPEKRYALWKEMYGFAAVPPGPQGEAMAKQLLAAGWDKYAGALPVIEAGARAMRPGAPETLRKVADVLKPDGPQAFNVICYVGAFDDNAFSLRGRDGLPTVCVPLEMPVREREVVFPHEATHAVHMAVGHLSGGWERTIGTTVVEEGLAMEVSRVVTPGRGVRDYVSHRPGWWEEVNANSRAILSGIVPYLDHKDGDTVFRFTIGKGTTGVEREAYFAGWAVMEHLHAKGQSWAEIARVPEDQMPELVARTIDEILKEHA
jgi:hypothetical protein